MNVKKALFASSLFLCGAGVLPVTAGLPVPHDESEISSPMPEQQKKNRTITGNVTDGSTGEPLIGVSIMLKGSSEGTTTDLDGNFSLSVPVKAQLEFSYIGYKKQVLDVTDLVVANVKLESDNEMLAEVVVVGAGTQKKVSVTGAITSVKGAELHAPSSDQQFRRKTGRCDRSDHRWRTGNFIQLLYSWYRHLRRSRHSVDPVGWR